MSVYTRVEQQDLVDFLARYALVLDDATAAAHGIENSTFLIHAHDYAGQDRQLVLTLFEQFDSGVLPPYLDLLAGLANAGLPVPAALHDQTGERLRVIHGKPTVLVPRLPGSHCFHPGADHCRQIGALLAQLHDQQPALARQLSSERQRLQGFRNHLAQLPPETRLRAREVLAKWRRVAPGDTLIHCDLFRDNALFDEQGKLTGVLDFYNACLDRREYDLAVTLNDWAVTADGEPVAERQAALLAGYQDAGGQYDEALLPLALAVAALRFWLSRVAGPVSDQSQGLGSKDPAEFTRIFERRCQALEAVNSGPPESAD